MNVRLGVNGRGRRWGALLALVVFGISGAALESRAEPPFAPDGFKKLHAMVKPQKGEVLFWEIPWFLDVDEARAKAVAEDKPILVWSGYGGAPLAVC